MTQREHSISTEPGAGLSIKEGALYMGVCEKTFRKYVREQLIQTYPVGKRQRRVTRQAIDEARRSFCSAELKGSSQRSTDSSSSLSSLSGEEFLRNL